MVTKISIATRAYNVEKYIRQCVNSVLNQTFTEFEYILMDNGSTDKTSEIIDELALIDSRIRVKRYKENSTSLSSIEILLDEACGEYIVLLDSDDWIEPEFFAKLYQMAKDHNADIAVGGTCFHKVNGEKTFRKIEKEMLLNSVDIPNYFPAIYNLFRPAWGKLFRKDLVKKAYVPTPSNIIYGGDTFFCMNMLEYADKVVISDKVLHNYRHHYASVSNKYNLNRILADKFLFYRAEKLMLKFGKIDGRIYSFLFSVYFSAIVETINVLMNSFLSLSEKLAELEIILKDTLTQNLFSLFKQEKQMLDFKSSIVKVIMAITGNIGTKEDLEILYSSLVSLGTGIEEFILENDIKKGIVNATMLCSCAKGDKREFIKELIRIMRNSKGSDVKDTWKVIKKLFKDNELLSWIDKAEFVCNYAEIILDIFGGEYTRAMNDIERVLVGNSDIVLEEDFLFLSLNISAMEKNVPLFIYLKKRQAVFWLNAKRYNQADEIIKDLEEMCPLDEDVINLKKYYAREVAW
ncbi:MAG: hypothetical protein H6Q71_68 [Firmicutes bacterium]|nr:hypothetical protein [Bacillota bacterium]